MINRCLRRTRESSLILWVTVLCFGLVPSMEASEVLAGNRPQLVFAVVTEKPVTLDAIQVQVLSNGKVHHALLHPSEAALRNPMWKTIDMCQGIKAQAIPSPTGYEVVEFRILGASMLPMPLQAVAGDCFLKKALEYAPLVE